MERYIPYDKSKSEQVSQTPPTLPKGEKLVESTITAETFDFFRDHLEEKGFVEHTFVSEAYKKIDDTDYIVRREDPKNILTLLESGAYDITFPESERYSNCAEWKPSDGARNIQNAYLEGFTSLNGIVTVVGIEKCDHDDIQQLPDATSNFYGIQREGVRSFQGEVALDRVAFISLRIPGHLARENELTEDELYFVDEYLDKFENGEKADPVMIHRVFLKEKEKTDDA